MIVFMVLGFLKDYDESFYGFWLPALRWQQFPWVFGFRELSQTTINKSDGVWCQAIISTSFGF